ncbi:hypothetical protein ACWD01_33560 [Streptomyces sp. NPDC002835]
MNAPILIVAPRLPLELLPTARTFPLLTREFSELTPSEWMSPPLVLAHRMYCSRLSSPDNDFRRRPGIVVLGEDLDDALIWSDAAAIGSEAVVMLSEDVPWLVLRMHEATDFRYVDWSAPFNDPGPQPVS